MDKARTVSENRLEDKCGLLDVSGGDTSEPPRTNGGVDGHHVILVGRIDPMEHVEPVYGSDDGDEDADGASWGSGQAGYTNGDLHGSFKATLHQHDSPSVQEGATFRFWGEDDAQREDTSRAEGLSLASLLKGGNSDWPYHCPICRRRFARYGHYARHLHSAHRNVASPPMVHEDKVASEDDSEDSSSEDQSEVGKGDDSVGQQGASFMYGDTVIFKVSKEDIAGRQRKQRTYVCRVCGEHFADREARARHVRDHELFHCEVCGRGFKDKSERDHHSSMYTGKPAHRCNDCGKHFHLTHSFARHMRTHTGEQPFSCDVCGKRFNDSGNMAKHVRTHTGELPFECGLCGKRFNDRGNQIKHMRSHHLTDRPFPCDVCGRGFANASNLARHFKANHTSESEPECYPR